MNSNAVVVNGWLGRVSQRTLIFEADFANSDFVRLHVDLADRIDIMIYSDHAYILQPPTKDTWGLAIFFHTLNGDTRYTTAWIKPLSIQAGDISAHAISSVSSAVPGSTVNLTFSAQSTFKYDLEDVSYEVQSNGIVEIADTQDLPREGAFNITYSFTMPENDVTVRFAVNEARDNPESEEDWENNDDEITVLVAADIDRETDFEIDYNILQRNIRFQLGEALAQLTLPRGTWTDVATGQLNVYNDTPNIYNDFVVENNEAVNEASEAITRNPLIRTLLRREDFGDNPLTRTYGETNTDTGQVSADGEVNRSYSYRCGGCRGTGEFRYCPGHYLTTTASFNRITNTNNITANVYNGMELLTPPTFTNDVDHNNISNRYKKLWWTSDPITLDVVRLMYNQGEDDTLSDKTEVDGRYERSFIEQNEGDLQWEIGTPMQDEYVNDRNKSQGRDYNLSGDEKVVLASDLRFRTVTDYYPIRSGYFFNPSGTYSFTLTTEIYKDTPDETQEHKDLVDAMIAAFRYESDMVYIDSSRQAVTIGGQSLSRVGTAFSATTDFVTTEDSPYFDIDVDIDYNLDNVEELLHDYIDVLYESGGVTDSRLRAVLEGYSESDTLSSRSDYKYVEYVHEGEEVYKITETSTVVITINPDNTKLYTHAQMRNGDYRVRVYIDMVDLDPLTYGHLTTLAGIGSLDQISIKVIGSMFEDAR